MSAAAYRFGAFNPAAFDVGLVVTSGLRIATAASLTADQPLTASPRIAVGVTATLRPSTGAVFAATAGLRFATSATPISPAQLSSGTYSGFQANAFFLGAFSRGALAAGFRFSVTATGLTEQALLSSGLPTAFNAFAFNPSAFSIGLLASGFRIGSVASLSAAAGFRAAAEIDVGVAATLTRLPASFAVVAGLRFSTTGRVDLVGPTATTVIIAFNGVTQTGIRRGSLTITDALNEQANTCDFVLDGTPPAIDADLKIGLGNLLPGNLLFAGTVDRVLQRYEARREHLAWNIAGVDYTSQFNRQNVYGTWRGVSASAVAIDIVTRYTTGFSTAGIVGGLPAITITLIGVPPMQALVQVAEMVGGYAYVDYSKVVQLFVSDATNPPAVVDGSGRLLLNTPAITVSSDKSQVRTRQAVKGKSAAVQGPEGFTVPIVGQIPVDDASIFSAGQVLTDDGQILSYTGVAPGESAATVRGNVAAPAAVPTVAVAVGVAGDLDGTYRWVISFGNAAGETEVGPPSTPPLTVSAFQAPSSAPGLGVVSNVQGPLVGLYRYRVTFVTTRGETLPGPSVSRLANALAPPSLPAPGVVDAPAAGTLQVGATYRYVVTYTTAYGETAPSAPVTYIPSALPPAGFVAPTAATFGGLVAGPYVYGISIVTAVGESAPPNTGGSITGTFQTAAPTVAPAWTGQQDLNGRVAPQTVYLYALSTYSDLYGETPLGPTFRFVVGGTAPGRYGISIPTILPDRADGLRVYRGVENSGGAMQLNADFRRGSIPSSYWDTLSQGECGNPWPIHQLRAGVLMLIPITPSSAPGVLARRLYRTKAGGSELFLVAEIQNNNSVTVVDSAFDSALTTRNPVVQTTGRQASLFVPVSPIAPSFRTGILGRRVYRTAANGSVYFLIADLKEVSTTALTDNTPDTALTGATVASVSTAGGDQHLLQSIPIGPTGTLARRIYRTVAGGTDDKLVTQINNNSDTTYIDSTPDLELGPAAPLTNTAGAAAVTVTVPFGETSVTERHVYRTKALPVGQTVGDYLYVGTISDNTTPTLLDDKADKALGRKPQTVSTIGALAGDNSLVVTPNAAGWVVPGWVTVDGQIVRFTGITQGTAPAWDPARTGDTLTGIPSLLPASITRSGLVATLNTSPTPHGFTTGQRIVVLGADQPEYTGSRTVTVLDAFRATFQVTGSPATPATGTIKVSAPGALTAAVAGGSIVTTVPMLLGVSGLTVPLSPGDPVALFVVRNSAAGQAALGIYDGPLVTDSTLDSVAACAARGDAELALNQFVRATVTYDTLDTKSRSGKTVHVALGAPQNITGDFLIQTVTITDVDQALHLTPRYRVSASNARFSLQDLLRHVVLDR
jgi:hypothetical protein